MTLLSVIFPDIAEVVQRKWFKNPGPYDHAVPAGALYLRASITGCGGYGDNIGGGGAFVRSLVMVTPGENLKIQVGNTSTQSVLGDSFVKRNDGVTVIAYADRGRGGGAGGSAAFSTGDVKRSGEPGVGTACGDPGDDVGDVEAILGPFEGWQGSGPLGSYSAGPGGAGLVYYVSSADETVLVRPGRPAGSGLVCLEFFDGNPGM